MRVCFVSHTAGRGGAELALLELLQGLIAEGVDCKVLVPKRGPILAELDRLHVEWKIIHYPRWMVGSRGRWMLGRITRTAKAVLMAISMARTITKWRCDIVVSNTIAIGAGALAARVARLPHVWHLHEFGFRDPNLLFDLGEHRTTYLINRLSTVFIANSDAVFKDYAQYINQHRMRKIYQAVTLRDELENVERDPGTNPVFRCVIVGSLHVGKGQDDAIRALAELGGRGIDVELLLVGDGSRRFRETLHQLVKSLELEQSVRFIGYAENPAQFIRIADVMLVCSRWEAFGRATVEAMLAGKPVIGTANSGGTTELIQDGRTGLLYEAGRHIELADKIQYLFENIEERSRLGAAAHIWAAGRFTQERYAKEVLGLFREVLANEEKI